MEVDKSKKDEKATKTPSQSNETQLRLKFKRDEPHKHVEPIIMVPRRNPFRRDLGFSNPHFRKLLRI